MQKSKALICLILTLLAACSPQRLQSARIAEYKHGRPYYQMTGYTDLGDFEPQASRKYVEYSLSDLCPNGVDIDFLQEYDSRNGAGKFLYWEALAGCKASTP